MLHSSEFLEILLHAAQQLGAELLVRHLTATKSQRYLCLVTRRQKPNEVPQLDLVITFLGAGPKFDLLDVRLLLLSPRRLRLLVLLEDKFAVIHDTAHGRVGVRCDLHEIPTSFLCLRQSFCDGHDTHLFAVSSYDAYLRRRNLVVAPDALTLDYIELLTTLNPSISRQRRPVTQLNAPLQSQDPQASEIVSAWAYRHKTVQRLNAFNFSSFYRPIGTRRLHQPETRSGG